MCPISRGSGLRRLNKTADNVSIITPPVKIPLLTRWFLAFAGCLAANAFTNQPIVREELFDGPILKWEILMKRSELNKLRNSGGGAWGNRDRADAVCSVRAGTNIWTNVSVHLKGAAGSFRHVDDTPALTLNFGKLQDGQTCFGHRKIHLNNSVQDPARIDEIVASEMYLRSGVPTPRATHAYVSLNGRYLGLYVLKGGWDKPFLKQHFSSAKGNFYDGAFVQDIDSNLERDSGEGEPDWADLAALRKAVRVNNPEARLEAMGKCLDIERFLSFTAIQVLVDDWDGYTRNRNNYRIYNDPSTGLLVFLPHGMDQLWRSPRGSFTPRFNGLVANRLYAIPGMASRLGQRMNEMTNSVFNAAFFDEVIDRAQKRLADSMKAEGRQDEYAYIAGAINDTRNRIQTRLSAFTGEVYRSPVLAKFDASGRMTVSGWRPQREGVGARLESKKLPEGNEVYVISAENRGSVGSYRSRLLLPWGRYRFEAKARAKDIAATGNSRGAGAGIRISGSRRSGGLQGTSDWRLITYEFVVNEQTRGGDGQDLAESESGREVMLVVELTADQGEVEFDPSSFVLTKL